MPSTADYRCGTCGFVREFTFDGIPPSRHTHTHMPPLAPEKPCKTTELYKVWSPPHLGRMSSGEPPR